MKFLYWIKQRSSLQIMAIAAATVIMLGSGLGFVQHINQDNTANNPNIVNSGIMAGHDTEYQASATPEAAVLASTSNQAKASLLYLVEEEKLAHDIYVTMYQKYGVKIFSNITNSETQHQNLVVGVLSSRGIIDPRSAEIGVFVNKDLQKLYNNLVTQGSQNVTEAYKVGIAIEQMDIADLKNDIAALDPAQTDVMSTMQTLLKGSENHLRAFNRKLG